MQKYSGDCIIKSYQTDKNSFIKLSSLFHILEDFANNGADFLDVGKDFMDREHKTWYATQYHIKLYKDIKYQDKLKIFTWSSGFKFLTATREFQLFNEKQELVADINSNWALLDLDTLKPVKMDNFLSEKTTTNEKYLTESILKIRQLEKVDFSKEFQVRYDDIDLNNHVNNSVYPTWVIETFPIDFLEKHKPTEIEISFKKSAFFGDEILVETELKDNTSYSIISSKDKSKIFAYMVIIWK